MDRKIKLLALDLDGTVLRSNNTLSDKVKSAIESANYKRRHKNPKAYRGL